MNPLFSCIIQDNLHTGLEHRCVTHDLQPKHVLHISVPLTVNDTATLGSFFFFVLRVIHFKSRCSRLFTQKT